VRLLERANEIAVFRESRPGERRVALTPDAVKSLVAEGWTLEVQRDAGAAAHFTNEMYVDAGATVVETPSGTSPCG
jgi:NAD(P) transhydrogenase subunit alpha